MNDLKDFIVYALKNPILWGVAIVWISANLKWLVPTAPAEVIRSFTDLLTVLGVIVVAYLGGKDVGERRADRFMRAQRLKSEARQEFPHG